MKKVRRQDGLVYSTDPEFRSDAAGGAQETLQPGQQKLRIRLDTRNRAGKTVTLIEGFIGQEGDLGELGKRIKTFCGTGGSARDGEIIIQGDHRDKVLQWLSKNGFKNVKRI